KIQCPAGGAPARARYAVRSAQWLNLSATSAIVNRMSNDTHLWSESTDYMEALMAPADPVLDSVQQAADEAGLPQISLSPLQARMLQLLAGVIGARRILEVGTLAGYSAIHMARSLPADGKLVTLEIDDKH